MSTQNTIPRRDSAAVPNGPGAAAILAAGIGSFAVAVLTVAADKSVQIKNLLAIYKPTGALSGVTTGAIVVWLTAWAILEWRWRKKTIPLKPINVVAFVLLGLSLLLTFPPLGELL
jgi:membrane associated rhomboid family serine protease